MNAKYYFSQAERLLKQNKDREAKVLLEKAISMATMDNNLPILIPANYAYANLLLKHGKEKEAQGIFQFIIDKTAEIQKDWQGVFDKELQGAQNYFVGFYNEEEKVIQQAENDWGLSRVSSFEELKEVIAKIAATISEYISKDDIAKLLGYQEELVLLAVVGKDKRVLTIGKKAVIFNADIETVVPFKNPNTYCVSLCNIEPDGSIEEDKQPVNNLYCVDEDCKILWSFQGSILKRREFCLDISKVDEKTLRVWTIAQIAYDIDVMTTQITKKKYIKIKTK